MQCLLVRYNLFTCFSGCFNNTLLPFSSNQTKPNQTKPSFSLTSEPLHSDLVKQIRSKMGSGAGNLLKLIAQNFDILAGPVVSLAYPLYASIRAIETKSPIDDQQWLTYWVLYSMITLFELTFAKLIEWIPFWSYAKLIVTCWLVIPYFSGAAYVYEQYVRPFYTGKQTINIWYVPRKKDVFSKPDDILTAAEKYIQEHGPDAFQEIIHRSDREVRHRGNTIFSEHDYRY
ncbi:hypothetical protein L1987_66699 [Smallanthus sonchifolius]|uniref:Uncharacterized protein n=1 Tax=Smallanthus sonchifolius TaxID=185202 RepID=A0ACB9BY58_9ASTR|nr:hypothetical protein L1987_66699 [Smallanthus sonchifolius]